MNSLPSNLSNKMGDRDSLPKPNTYLLSTPTTYCLRRFLLLLGLIDDDDGDVVYAEWRVESLLVVCFA